MGEMVIWALTFDPFLVNTTQVFLSGVHRQLMLSIYVHSLSWLAVYPFPVQASLTTSRLQSGHKIKIDKDNHLTLKDKGN